MRLVFTEQGRRVGEVRVLNGALIGSPVWTRMVETTMRRDRVTARQAAESLDGWSNGYLTVTLHRD